MTTTPTPCVLDASRAIRSHISAQTSSPSTDRQPPPTPAPPLRPDPLPPTPTSAPFDPDPDTTERLLEDLACDHDSLLALSKAYGATLDGLCEWMQRPENAVRIARISAAAAQRAHLAASIQLPKCVVVLVDMVKGYHHQENHDPIRNDLKQCRLRETQRANARKAIHLLYTFHRIGAQGPSARPAPPIPRTRQSSPGLRAPTPGDRAGGAGDARSSAPVRSAPDRPTTLSRPPQLPSEP
ncbi:MAG: hypothetical protein H6811_02660 [Phycisphaeraceae bacterium]|nr:hypothetical protein [Phycisphaeraceae bacterium]